MLTRNGVTAFQSFAESLLSGLGQYNISPILYSGGWNLVSWQIEHLSSASRNIKSLQP